MAHKSSLLLIMLLLLGMPLTAQKSVLHPYFLGGYQFTAVSSSVDYRPSGGFRVGAGVDIGLGGSGMVGYSFSPSVNFSKKGFNFLLPSMDYVADTRIGYELTDLYYVDMPLLLDAYLETRPGMGFHGNVGPYVGYLINASGDGDGSELKKFDYGLQVGGGFEYYHWLLMVGLQYGLQNISSGSDHSYNNRILYLTVGYRF